MIPYWRLTHKAQNRLLLVVSYLFYGYWDYRFLFLILLSTYIDFIGGLGVAGVRLPIQKLIGLTGLVVGTAVLLCSGIRYERFPNGDSLVSLDAWLGILPQNVSDLSTPIAAALVGTAYVAMQPILYSQTEAIRRRAYLIISMTANLTILAYFKYCDFFVSSFVSLMDNLGIAHWNHDTLGIVLPAGISFYTFQSMSYAIDIYRKETEPTDDFADFALFVCFFPHLVAGPIMRAHSLLPQVLQPRKMQSKDWEAGAFLVLAGMFKKLVIADNLAPIADNVFQRFHEGNAAGLSGVDALIGIYAFALQIYADFSGYSSVARGISKWLGFELVVNFRQPYLAVSPSDFWQRWHISLSTWLRDYLYIPIGGNRCGKWRNYGNLMLTMLLGGLWHGANWTFVVWGLFHGLILCLFKAFGIRDPKLDGTVSGTSYYVFRVLLMFHLTCLGWLFFRAENFGTVVAILQSIGTDFAFNEQMLAPLAMIILFCGPIFILESMIDPENQTESLTMGNWLVRGMVYAYALMMIMVFQADVPAEFIYFQF